MIKFDYWVAEARTISTFQIELDQYGQEGYRVIHVGYNPDRERYFAVMEREVED